MDGIIFMNQMCEGCSKLVDKAWSAAGYRCTVYAEPHKTVAARHNVPCPFNPPKVEAKKKGFINPLKASKRRSK